jgi:hypothetical protein
MAVTLLNNPAVWAILLGFVLVLVSFVVKKTKTKKDDLIFDIIKGAVFHGFNIAEGAITDDTQHKSLAKIDTALKTFNDRVQDALGRNATKEEIEQAKALWAELAYEVKNS